MAALPCSLWEPCNPHFISPFGMRLTSFTAVALASAFYTSAANAQERFTALVDGGFASPVVLDVEVDAGGVTDLVETRLALITPVAIPNSFAVGRVGGQLWLGTEDGIFRYDEVGGASRYAFVDQIVPGARYTEITLAPAGVIAMRLDVGTVQFSVEVLDPNGSVVQSFPVDRIYRSFVPFGAGYLAVSDSAGVEELDASFQPVGRFAPDAEMAADAAGIGYFPDALTRLSDGRIVISASVSLAITNSAGDVLAIANPGAFESGAIETGGGLLLVPCADGLKLLDPDTLEAFEIDGDFVADLGRRLSNASSSALPSASARACTGAPNSVGPGARIHLLGVDDSVQQTLSAVGVGMPGNTFALPVFGTASFDAPYGDGRLCVSPFQQGVTRGIVQRTSALGSAQVRFEFQTAQTGASFLPGTTWHFQMIYRDAFGAAGFNGTDGVSITFRP